MVSAPPIAKTPGPSPLLGWPRVRTTLVASALLGLLISPAWVIPTVEVIGRTMLVGLFALLAYGVFERWPRHLPGWVARWALQVVGVSIAIPLGVLLLYLVTTGSDQPPFWQNPRRLNGFMMLTMTGLILAPWMAVSALFRQREEAARNQALSFELERSELERKALDARLRLLQAQVEPHFLFNTLANVRELVVSGSPQASAVLDSLISYLRAAVPRLHEASTTLGQELQLVKAYLELMHLRMPDRMQFQIRADEPALGLRCPPMTLLTLVENAVRHGIDPSEEGGRIDVCVQVKEGRVCAQVSDTGVGLKDGAEGLGTGIATLRERLQLAFGSDAKLTVVPVVPNGVRAEVEFPAEPAPA